MFSFANATRPPASCASSSRIVSIARHGLHHGAQKSTTTGSAATASSKVLESSSRIPQILEPAQERREAQDGNSSDCLEEDRPAHLRVAGRPVDELDRDLDDVEAGAQRAVRALDLEGVALR